MNKGLNILRWYFGIAFLIAGLDKVFTFSGKAGMFDGLFGGAGTLMLVIAIVVELGGGIALLANWKTKQVTMLLMILILVALVMTFGVGQAPNFIGTLRELLVMNTGGSNTAVNLAYLAGLAAMYWGEK